MANQTVTTTVNYDDALISGLLDGETITINGGSVTINADVRWNQQAAVFGPITISTTAGGAMLFDGTTIWEVPFSASTGNVPTQGALGTNGVTGGTSGATGELTRVWATGSLEPAAAGGAMPATGFIKLRSKTGNFVSGETITLPGGATITASGAGKRSWIHVVGRGVTTGTGSRISVPRLGNFQITGDWYELGTTNGADNQTFQFPVADMCPAIWIETAPSSGVYEIWLCAGDRWSGANGGAVATSDRRGMYFGCVASTGVITLALRGPENAGLKPPSGCRVRIPNVILSSANGTLPDWSANILPAAVTQRYGPTTSSGGSLSFDRVTCNWVIDIGSAFAVNVSNSAIGGFFRSQNAGTTVTLNNVGVGLVDTINYGAAIWIGVSPGGGSLTDVFCTTRIAVAGGNSLLLADTFNFILTRCRSDVFGLIGTNATSGSMSCFELLRAYNTVIDDCIGVGGIGIDAQPAFGLKVNNFKYAQPCNGTTQPPGAIVIFVLRAGNSCDNVYMDGVSIFDNISNVHPYDGIISADGGSSNIELRNVGTPSSPFNGGTVNSMGVIANLGTSRKIVVRRAYAQNTRTGAFSSVSTCSDFQAYNIWADATDVNSINNSLNSTIRGGRFTNSTAGGANVYGTHWFDCWTSTTTGRIVISCNEPTADTIDQCSATFTPIVSGFTSSGTVVMTRIGDEITWTMPYFALGVTGFANTAPTITGSQAANHTFSFQYDLNNGFGWNGAWLPMTAANLSAITVDPAKGVKLRVRATVNTASASNSLTHIRIDTVTDAVSQQIEYSFPGSVLSLIGLIPNSRVKVTRVDTGALLAQDTTAGTSLTLDVPYSGAVRIEARNASGATTYKPWVTQISIASGTTTTVTALQETD
jgi:hypothetical protein